MLVRDFAIRKPNQAFTAAPPSEATDPLVYDQNPREVPGTHVSIKLPHQACAIKEDTGALGPEAVLCVFLILQWVYQIKHILLPLPQMPPTPWCRTNILGRFRALS